MERPIDSGEVHEYTVDLKAGTFLHAVVEQISGNVAVTVHDPEGDTLVEADSMVYSGPEAVLIEAARPGAYRLQVRWVWGNEGRYELRVETRTAAEHAAFLAGRRAEAEAARAWIRDHAIPLATAEAGRGFADLQPIRRIVGDARIVALGEATHGTREFFQLKHRLLEFLVSELGFDIFAIEATLPEAMDVNRYVLTGEGDPARALAGMYFWTWDTEEVLELIRWMRRYNENPRHTRKVKFYGFDMQRTARAARVALDYLRRVDQDAAAAAESVLDPVADPFLERQISARWSRERKQALLDSIRTLAAKLDERRADYVTRSSAAEWDLTRQHVHILEQAMESRAAANAGLVRDSSMAANVAWILGREGPDSKAVLWAHNFHVSTQAGAMGWYLRRRFGDGMRAFGLTFDRGEFQSRNMMDDGALRPYRVEGAPEGSLEGQLAAAGLQLTAVDLRGLPETGPVASWFARPKAMRSLGAGYNEDFPHWYWWRGAVAQVYDVLFFVRETSAARGTPTGRRPGAEPPGILANPGFEEGDPGEWPPGWTGQAGIAGVEWAVELTRRDAREGEQAVIIQRAAGGPYGETHAELSQRIDASPWRGRRVTFSAWVRVEPATPPSRAYLWLNITQPGELWSESVFYNNMEDRPITGREWRPYRITADVPESADAISFGLAFVGEGRAWLDNVSLEAGFGTEP